MQELKVYSVLKEAYENTTPSDNVFKRSLKRVKWDHAFEAEGKHHYLFKSMTLVLDTHEPFEELHSPYAVFRDGSVLSFR